MTSSFRRCLAAIPIASAVAIAIAAIISPAEAFPSTALNASTKPAANATLVDSRLYRHCHIKGSRSFVVCMTADPWSPEHMELDRRAGRFNHEGGPVKRQQEKPHSRHGTPS